MGYEKTGAKAPDTKRYVVEHGNGVTDAGIGRALKLLPAMRAIGDPDAGSGLDGGDLADVRACLEAYKKNGKLSAKGAAGSMFSDMGAPGTMDAAAAGRLGGKRLPDGSTAYRAAFQAVPLAMSPSADLCHEGYWYFLCEMAGLRNMEAFTDCGAAGRSMAGALDFGGGGLDEAAKLAACWKGLDMAAPCGLPGAENSLRMMQFCAIQNVAGLDGYDLAPDETTAKAMGRVLRDGLEDMDGFRYLVGRSLEPSVQGPAKAGPKTHLGRLRSILDDMDRNGGLDRWDGPEPGM